MGWERSGGWIGARAQAGPRRGGARQHPYAAQRRARLTATAADKLAPDVPQLTCAMFSSAM
eukprot:6205450-Pleurochrysis_carterae.AAC.3